MLALSELARFPFVRLAGQLCAYVVAVAVLAALDIHGLHTLARSLEAALPLDFAARFSTRDAGPAQPAPVQPVSVSPPPAAIAVYDPPPIGPSADGGAAPWSRSATPTYRTMCVRLCDGYFFPVSFATSPEFFGNDEAVCQENCATPARLYVFKNPGEAPAAMENLDGRPYSRLDTAYKFRAEYDPACTCKGQPWDEAARDRHRVYALRDAKARGKTDTSAKAELARLESRIESRLRQTKAAYRVAGLGDGERRRGRAAVIARYKAKTRFAALPPPKQAIAFPGFMGLGASATAAEPSKKGSPAGKAARREETTIGDIIQQAFGGF